MVWIKDNPKWSVMKSFENYEVGYISPCAIAWAQNIVKVCQIKDSLTLLVHALSQCTCKHCNI